MQSVTARVWNGRLVVDEPTDLPEGDVVELVPLDEVLAREAREQIRRIDAWWRENRTAAPDLFTNELIAALEELEAMPSRGPPLPFRYLEAPALPQA